MVDNKPMEVEALDFVKNRIRKYGYNYADLSCDKKGTDLFAFKDITSDSVKVIKVQSKGRNIIEKVSNVKIYQHYVTNDFVCFLYLKTDDEDNDYLYLYFQDDIVKWKENKGKNQEHDEYELYIGKDFVEKNKQFLFNSVRAKLLDELFEQQVVEEKPRCFDHTSMLRSFYDLWCEYDIRPDKNALRIIDNDRDVICYNEQIGIFLACMLVVQDREGDFYGIDWFVEYINRFDFRNEIEESLVIRNGKRYSSAYQITYISYVEEIQYGDDCGINGFHLYIGDKEEEYDIYLLRDGRYGVMRKVRTQSIKQNLHDNKQTSRNG